MTIPFPSSRVSTYAPKSSSSSSPSRFKSASSNNPDKFASNFDLIESLYRDPDKYIGETQKSLSIISFPQFCRINIDRVHTQVKSPIGVHALMSACVYHGISHLVDSSEIRTLSKLKHRFNLAPTSLNSLVSSTISQFLDGFVVSLPKGYRRQNVWMPSNHHAMLFKTSREIGISSQSLAILAIMAILSSQDHVNDDNKQEMAYCLEQFYGTVRVKVTGAEALMDAFGV